MENFILANGKKFFIHHLYKKYAANEDGEIMNVRLRNVKKGNLGHSGYLRFTIRLSKSKCKTYLSHRFIYECFYGLIEKNKQINHKNFIKIDNRLENLEVVSASENIKKSLLNKNLKDIRKNPKRVTAINLLTNKETNFNSIYSVNKILGINPGQVKMLCDGIKYCKTATSKIDGQKYTFKYLSGKTAT